MHARVSTVHAAGAGDVTSCVRVCVVLYAAQYLGNSQVLCSALRHRWCSGGCDIVCVRALRRVALSAVGTQDLPPTSIGLCSVRRTLPYVCVFVSEVNRLVLLSVSQVLPARSIRCC